MDELMQITPVEQIEAFLAEEKLAPLREYIAALNPMDLAACFADLPEEKIPLIFRLLPKELAAEVFVEMDSDLQELLIHGLSNAELKDMLDELYLDDAVDLLEEMPANVVRRILANTDPDTRKLINQILQYPEDSAGSIMTVEYIRLQPKMTAKDAIARIRHTGIDKETIYTCYVTDSNKILLGIVTVKDLLMASDNDIIADFMDTNVISARTTEDKELVAQKFAKYDFIALPVVDEEGRLVGIVTVDDAMDVIQEEATEDIEKMAAIAPTPDKTYLKTSVFELWKARIPWLLFLMISATFTGAILTHFEDAMSKYVALVTFIPMLMDTGGNAGGQASVTIIRGLSLGEIRFRDTFRVLLKEGMVSICCGVTLAVANFFKLMLINRESLLVSVVVCLTLVVVVIAAKLVGSLLPILAKMCHLDPAVMAHPMITTIVDALSLSIYFFIATALLGL